MLLALPKYKVDFGNIGPECKYSRHSHSVTELAPYVTLADKTFIYSVGCNVCLLKTLTNYKIAHNFILFKPAKGRFQLKKKKNGVGLLQPRYVDGRQPTPNLLFFFHVLNHPNLQRKFFSCRGGVLVLVLKNFFREILPKFIECVHQGEKKFFSSKILFLEHAKNIKKIAFCTPKGVGR